jgi:hypothetical protein
LYHSINHMFPNEMYKDKKHSLLAVLRVNIFTIYVFKLLKVLSSDG